jgi:DNA modification methylase
LLFQGACAKCGARRIDAQIGLESTPAEYVEKMVAVFADVRRVLRDDGTLWLNLGDSYGAGGGAQVIQTKNASHGLEGMCGAKSVGAKQLAGIPWRVAFALQQPYYTGKVKDERDRVWLAAMVDAEGSICGTEYLAGDRTKTNLFISVTNTSVPIIDKCERLFPQDVKHVYEKSGPSSRVCYRWDVERMELKSLFLREIYPHLVAKRKQAILGYTFVEMQRGLESKKKGYLAEQHEQRSWLMAALSKLNAGEDIDLPDWVIEPPSLFEPGFYLRQDIIWAKPNPMPESVRDRCTKAHEYLFLLAKSERYYFDADAISEPIEDASRAGKPERVNYADASKLGRSEVDPHIVIRHPTRNKRSVWTVTTGRSVGHRLVCRANASQPYPDAHFATFPPKLIEPCILAGAPAGGVIIDPFNGSGTTGLVAIQHGRHYVGIELNREYCDIAVKRMEHELSQPCLPMLFEPEPTKAVQGTMFENE